MQIQLREVAVWRRVEAVRRSVADDTGTSYDPTTYLNQQATTAPFASREASAAERLRSSRHLSSDRSLTAGAFSGTDSHNLLDRFGES
jgi:hypothetical protein